jgi:RNA polymerase sigma-70 factor (family 1)
MQDYSVLSDFELAAFLKQGDPLAFTEVYDRYWSVLYLHARRMLRDDQEAQDIVQELFAEVWRRAPEISYNVKLSSYLYKSIRNRVFDYIEHKKVVDDYQRSLIEFIATDSASSDELVRERELALIIEQEIAALPPKMREVFELSRKQHLSYREIGEQLGISEHTVKRQVSNALGILRTKLGVSSIIVFMLLSK